MRGFDLACVGLVFCYVLHCTLCIVQAHIVASRALDAMHVARIRQVAK